MFYHPAIDPVAFSLGPVKVHWYGLMYLLGFLLAYILGNWRAKHYQLNWTREQISDLIFYLALGVILGGRLFFMVFYHFQTFLHQPWIIFKIWKGGMSFHGGVIGVAFTTWLFARKYQKSWFDITDFVVPLVPLGLACGRLGNFINGELWGRVTDMPWGVVFPAVDNNPRHPSQLYELGLEGILLFIIIWWYASKPRAPGQITGVFLVGYALCRIFVECFREPDNYLGFIAFDWLTMGQMLSIPMLLIGIWLGWLRR